MKKLITISLSVLLLALAIMIGACLYRNLPSNKYQAVFLDNGQVYFGKVAARDMKYIVLTDIYYLQLQQNLQNQNNAPGTQPDISLVKLGGELHGPEDKMEIVRDHILFIEDLRNDSKVSTAIRDDKAKKVAK